MSVELRGDDGGQDAALVFNNGDTGSDGLVRSLEGLQFDGPKGTYVIRPEDHDLLQPMALVKLVNTNDPDYKFFQLVKMFRSEETAPPCGVPDRCK